MVTRATGYLIPMIGISYTKCWKTTITLAVIGKFKGQINQNFDNSALAI